MDFFYGKFADFCKDCVLLNALNLLIMLMENGCLSCIGQTLNLIVGGVYDYEIGVWQLNLVNPLLPLLFLGNEFV